MTDAKRNERNQQRVTELFPSFRTRIVRVISELEAAGLRPRIQDAWRSPDGQLAAFENGTSKLKFGFHNVTGANGAKESLAVDMLDDDSPLNSKKPYLLQLAAAAQRNGLATGIRWGLPKALREVIDDVIATADWDRPVKIGWDPTHVEPIGITPTEAKRGSRPS